MTHDPARWWRSAVIYQIYPKSWMDADGDGVGDIAGIRARLGYLARLGIDAVWFSPWYVSPQADGGYDVADHRRIDPLFGDNAAAANLINEAHDLGLKIIVDIVPNHLSDQHALFQRAVTQGPGSSAAQLFHILRGKHDGQSPPNDWQSVFGGPAWSPLPGPHGRGWWYLHLFAPQQPDLNWEHPDVDEEFAQTLRFWLDMGVDGFRIDVATGLSKAPGYPDMADWAAANPAAGRYASPFWDQRGVHEVWRRWRRIIDEYQPPRAFVGEVWVEDAARHAQYLRPDELHTAFNFDYLLSPWDGATLRRVITNTAAQAAPYDAALTWALENHDVPRARTRYGLSAAGFEVTRTERQNLPADDVRGLARARAALLFMLGLPGSAYIYQGQELGLPEYADLPDHKRQDPSFASSGGEKGFRDGCRVPFPWSAAEPSYGFSENAETWLPMPAGWGQLSVERQADDPESTLELTRTALRLRATDPALGDGPVQWESGGPVDPGDPSGGGELLVVRRAGPNRDLLVAMNLGEQAADLPAGELLVSSAALQQTPTGWQLPPDAAAWFVA